ncbi:MAG: hypothetical protein A2808_03945 [Candidatus Moranbacteria bacterium RIFCSPHIGHO2_01_FULL_55_24]|nr:MAG: hypothetical protein A2808_03945 [Candidatus Moranbacteria bacterium RIFCSPHIGHO2_01_FULL_55_24]
MEIFTVETEQERQVVDLTDKVNEIIGHHPVKGEMCHLFIRHTTAALTIVPIDPKRELDLIGMIEAMVPHHLHVKASQNGHDHVATYLPADILASFVGSTLAIPVKNKKLMLGDFQRVVLLEFAGPSKREIVYICA